jgi:hypothetical protein
MRQSIVRRAVPVFCALIATMVISRAAPARDQQDANQTRLTATLVGVAPFTAAHGGAEFEQETSRARFKLEVEDINLADGTAVMVEVNGSPIAGGSLTVESRKVQLDLDSSNGQTVPVIGPGSTVAVTTTAGATVAAGQF